VDDCIIDTNVLLVASAHHPVSPFKDSDVPQEQMQVVFDWLVRFQKDAQRLLVLDPYLQHGILEEYRHKMTEQDFGLMVVKEKLQFARLVYDLEFDDDGHAFLPAGYEKIDPSDRKFVAVALKDLSEGGRSIIINAVDSDWHECEKELNRAGVTVKHLIERVGKGKSEDLGKKKRRSKAKR
jgi:hypothetical protein